MKERTFEEFLSIFHEILFNISLFRFFIRWLCSRLHLPRLHQQDNQQIRELNQWQID